MVPSSGRGSVIDQIYVMFPVTKLTLPGAAGLGLMFW
jgi:hypothetical protein